MLGLIIDYLLLFLYILLVLLWLLSFLLGVCEECFEEYLEDSVSL